MAAPTNQEWPEERIQELIRLFNYRGPDGHMFDKTGQRCYSREQIAALMGLSKNSVQGKLSRLHLTDSVSPQRTPDCEPIRRYPRGVPSLPPLPSLQGCQFDD